MHPNPQFRQAGAAENLAFAETRAFGTLAVNAPGGPLLAHVPYIVGRDPLHIDLHLVRSNPIVAALDRPAPAVMSVTGPDGYISPDWYDMAEQVPTWNYVAVHLRGQLERRPDSTLRDLLERQSALFEARLAPKPPWMPAKMTPDTLNRMMRAIVPCRLLVSTVDGTWKLGQNKPAAARTAAAAALDTGFGAGLASLARLMRDC